MKEGMNRYATKNRLVQKGYIFKYCDGSSGRKATEASRSNRVQQSRKEQKEEIETAIKVYGTCLVLTDEVVPNEPFSEAEQLALDIYAKALKEVAPILKEKHVTNTRDNEKRPRRDVQVKGHVLDMPAIPKEPAKRKRKTNDHPRDGR